MSGILESLGGFRPSLYRETAELKTPSKRQLQVFSIEKPPCRRYESITEWSYVCVMYCWLIQCTTFLVKAWGLPHWRQSLNESNGSQQQTTKCKSEIELLIWTKPLSWFNSGLFFDFISILNSILLGTFLWMVKINSTWSVILGWHCTRFSAYPFPQITSSSVHWTG